MPVSTKLSVAFGRVKVYLVKLLEELPLKKGLLELEENLLKEYFLFGCNKVRLFFVINMRVIVKFLFKKSFSKIKNNFKDISSKKPSKILKNHLKINLYISKYIS